MIKNHTLESNKNAFTLIELLISITLLVIIFVFLYGQFNLAYLSTDKTTQIEQNSTKKEMFLKLFYQDFISAKTVTPTNRSKHYDTLVLHTENSLYGISEPHVNWVVVKNEETYSLVRLESHKPIFIQERNNEFYMDVILEDINYFKIVEQNGYLEFFVESKDVKNIHFKLKRLL